MAFPNCLTVLRGALDEASATAALLGLSRQDAWNVLAVLTLRQLLSELASTRALSARSLDRGRLFRSVPGFEADGRDALRGELLERLDHQQLRFAGAFAASPSPLRELPVEAFGQLYETLLAARPSDRRSVRKLTGSYYTPEALTRVVVERAFLALTESRGQGFANERPLRIVDPALGAGAFLIQAGRAVAEYASRPLVSVVQRELFGVDVSPSPLAVAVAEASLWLLADNPRFDLEQAGANLREGDSLCTAAAARELGLRGVDWWDDGDPDPRGFDLVIGNPPWVAFAGRAAQPVAAGLRSYYRANYRSFRGYPILHGLFIELSARLAPNGVVALLSPSPVADLAGYRHVRSCLAQSHRAKEPLLELGQEAFESVTQPCFALIAVPSTQPATDPERALVLSERERASALARELEVPSALLRLASLPRLPAQLFG